jgi:hypothetical protein
MIRSKTEKDVLMESRRKQHRKNFLAFTLVVQKFYGRKYCANENRFLVGKICE